MEVQKYNPFVVTKTKPNPKPKPQPLPKAKTKPTPKNKLEAKSWGTKRETPLSLENQRNLNSFYAKGFVKTSRK